MRIEDDCKPYEKYLFADCYFTDEEISSAKLQCSKRYNNKFINWQKQDNEIAVFTLYAYAGFDIPKQFDIIFQLNKPSNYMQTNYTLTQSIYEGWLPSDKIDDGHKHLCIFQFENTIPEIIKLLSAETERQAINPNPYLMLGFCNSTDFDAIIQRIEKKLKLKKQYGAEWWKYDTV